MAHLVCAGRWAQRRLGNWRKTVTCELEAHVCVWERKKWILSFWKLNIYNATNIFPLTSNMCVEITCATFILFSLQLFLFLKFTLKSEVVLLSSKNSCSSSVSSQGSLKFYCREREASILAPLCSLHRQHAHAALRHVASKKKKKLVFYSSLIADPLNSELSEGVWSQKKWQCRQWNKQL